MRNRKGIGISKRTVIFILLILLIVFSAAFTKLFWKNFETSFKGKTGTGAGAGIAVPRCSKICIEYINAGCPKTGAIYEEVTKTRDDIDINGDGVINEKDQYSCYGNVSPVMTGSQCSC